MEKTAHKEAASPHKGDRESGVDELVQRWAERTPDAIAVIAADATLTYAELNARAEDIAAWLQAQGVGPEIPVAVCAERSAALVTAVIALFKAGGVYLPLDPRLPVARMRRMIEAAGARVLLTFKAPAALGEIPSVTAINISDASMGRNSAARSAPPLSPENAAYLIYTSGSTGEPRGVVVTRAGLQASILAQQEVFGARSTDRFLAAASISFDASILEMMLALSSGATIVTGDRDALLPGPTLVAFLETHRVTAVAMTPTVLATLTPERCQSVRLVIAGGEASTPTLLRRWAEGRRVFNGYGPTETTILSTAGEFKPADEALTIGHAFPGVHAGVLDEKLRPVPPGGSGELFLSGDCVARGYLHIPGKTADRFVPDCIGGPPGSRMYRTGDVVKVLPDGRLEFLGRADHQLKIRGNRVEPGEIEAAIVAAGATRAVVVPRHDRGDLRLVAYVVGADSGVLATASDKVATLRSALSERLPDYMVPAAWVFLDKLPIGPTGKVDRDALPPPPTAAEGRPYVAPRNAVEEALERIWADTLGHARVSITDSFYELGGDSILSIHIAGKAAQQGFFFSPVELMRRATIEALAPVVVRRSDATADNEIPPGPVPLTPVQRLFFERGISNPHHWTMGYVLDALEPLDLDRLERALADVVARHDALRTRFECQGGDAHAFYDPSLDMPRVAHVDLIELSPAASAEARLRAANELHASFRLGRGPRLRALLMDCGADGQKLLLVAHHAVVDGVSWHVILTDLEDAYLAQGSASPARRSAPTMPFATWARRLQGYANSAPLKQQLPFWTNQPFHDTAPIPRDFSADDNTVGSSRLVSFTLDAQTTSALMREASISHGAKINELLLAAFLTALRSWTGRSTLLINVEGHGREDILPDANLARTVGWFTTVFPLCVTLPSSDLSASAKAVHEHMQRIPEHGIGFGVLRYMSDDKATTSAMAAIPFPEVSFNYLGQWDHLLKDSTLLRLTADPVGQEQAPEDPRFYLLELEARVFQGQLCGALRYGTKQHHRETIESLVRAFEQNAKALAESTQAAPKAHHDAYPLTPVQLGMLHHTLKNIGGGEYVVQSLLDIEGDLDEAALAAAFRSLTARHPALRTAFVWEDLLEPVQVERASLDVPFDIIDARHVALHERERHLAALCDADRRRGHDPRNAPLFRVVLLRWSPRESTLLWSCHHLILDEFSGAILLRELFRHYDAHRQGIPLDLPPAPSFRAFVEWQRAAGTPEAYWRAELEGLKGPTDLGIEIASTSTEPRDELRERTLPAPLEAELRAFARRERVPLISLITAAWTLLFARYSGQSDVVFGLTLSGRSAPIPGIDSLIGNLLNTLPLRVTFEKGETLAAFVRRLHGRILGLRDHEASSLARIQALRNEGRSRTLFDHILVFDHLPEKLSHAELSISNVRALERTSYPLNLVVLPDGPIALRALFDVRRFAPEAIETMLQHLGELLALMPERADRPVEEIPCGVPRRETPRQQAVAIPAKKEMASPGHAAPRTDEERILARVFADVLGKTEVGIRDNFFDLGGDSIQSFQIVARASRAGLVVKNSQIFEHQTVEELARVAQKKPTASTPRPTGAQSQLAPLLPIQRWFFEAPPKDPAHFDYHLLLRVEPTLAPDAATRADVLRHALRALVLRHEALRGRFQVLPSGVAQRVAPMRPSDPILDVIDLPAASDDKATVAVNGAIEAQPPALHLARGPLFRALLFEHGGATRPHLLLVAHHLVTDVISLRVLLEDLVSACTQARNGADIDIPSPVVSYASWGDHVERYAANERATRQRDHWIAKLGGARLPRDHSGENHFEDAQRVLVALPEDWTAKLLAERPAKTSPRPVDFLVAALGLSLRNLHGVGAWGIMQEGHGRADLDPDLDLSRTVGWFTAMYPFQIALEQNSDPHAVLDQVRSATARVPDGGVGYGALKYVARDAALLAAIEAKGEPEIAFNFLGRVETPSGTSLVSFAEPDKPITLRRSGGARRFLLEVDAFIRGGRLLIQWAYSSRIHEERTIQSLADAHLASLRDLLATPSSPEKPSPTAADFPLASLNKRQLDSIAARIKRPKA